MDGEGRQERGQETRETERSGSGGDASVEWQDISRIERRNGEGSGVAETGDAPRDGTGALAALRRATELFVGPSEPAGECVQTYVTELPQWFRRPATTEARIAVGGEVFETEGFRQSSDPLTAAASTRTGTGISMTVVNTDSRSGTGQQQWLATERELIETVVSLLETEVDRWEIDSLKRVSDGVAALDTGLRYTYVNRQAEQILGRDRDELHGEHVWDVFPEAADTVAQERLEEALETQTPTSFERYKPETDQWVEVRVYPGDDGIVLFFTDISESKASERELEQILEATPAGIVLLSEAGEITRANARAEELLGLSRSDIEGRRYDCPDWDIWDENGDRIPRENHPVTRAITAGETTRGFTHGITLPDGSDRWLSSNVTPIFDEAGSIEHVVVALENITVLKRLEQLIETFRPVNEVLNSAGTRQETERDICALLTETRAYQCARIGEHTPGTVPTEASLRNRSETLSVDESAVPPVDSSGEATPTRVAVETGEVQVVTGDGTDPRFESWREHTLERGFQGGAIVPLSHGARIYGLLGLYTGRGDAFGEREVALLSTLGDRIGQVLHSLETERVLHADSVAELTFRSTDPGSFFVSASERLGCTIDIVDTIPAAGGTLVYYASVRDASLDALDDLAENADCAVQLRQTRQTDDPPGGDVEIELQQRSLAATLVTAGAVVTADTVTDGRAEVVCEVPLGHDIDSLVTRLTEAFPDTELVAKREYNRSARTARERSSQVLADVFREELTDRQQQILRAAIHTGYFESPRGSTATEIAEALSLTQSTFSYHLRNAQQTLFEAMLDRLELPPSHRSRDRAVAANYPV